MSDEQQGAAEGLVECPRCGGNGKSMAFLDGVGKDGKRHGWCQTVPCMWCGGTGNIDAVQNAAMIEGTRMREDRLARGVSASREAINLGISVSELIKRENGRILPAPAVKGEQG